MSDAETHLLVSPPEHRVRPDASDAPAPPHPLIVPLVQNWEPLRETVEETAAPCPHARRRAMLLMITSALAMSGAAYCLYKISRLFL
ncbi:MAG: hypothetical protein JO143_09695 [Acetobacteraceae bacterium]|nr:hypothetical protein [Acetobacteraceae bacterium]